MNILLVCQQSPLSHPVPAYGFWPTYFREGLKEAGHTIHEVADSDWARGLVVIAPADHERWLQLIWARTVERARELEKQGKIDLFLAYLFPSQIDPRAIEAIKNLGVPCVNFFCDNVRDYARLPDEFGPFDLHWVPEAAALPLYQKRRWRHVHAPMPCWVAPELRVLPDPAKERAVVSFIGGRDAMRASLIAELVRAQIPVEIRGPAWVPNNSRPPPPKPSLGRRFNDWKSYAQRQGIVAAARRAFLPAKKIPGADAELRPYVHPSPSPKDYPRYVAEAAVSIGVNRFPSTRFPIDKPGTYSRLRDIEAPMLGACYLTEWTDGLDKLYDLDREIAVYRSPQELVEQARALLADPERRARLRAAGQRRALTDHTVGGSLARIAAELNLPA